jgi:ABC-type phosphate transport system substrate-binding protein
MHIANNIKRTFVAISFALSAGAACAEVVVIVSAKSSVSTLSNEQATDIFLSAATFPGGSMAVPIDQSEGSPVRDEFYSKVASKSPPQLKAYWAKVIFTGKGRPPKEVPDSTTIKKLVADNPNIIGYVEKGAVDASVKVVLTVR